MRINKINKNNVVHLLFANISVFGLSLPPSLPPFLPAYPTTHAAIHLKTKQYVTTNLTGLTSGFTLPQVLFVET